LRVAIYRGVWPLLVVALSASGCSRIKSSTTAGAVEPSSAMKGSEPIVDGDGRQAPLPRVELGLRDHQLIEFLWSIVETGDHDGTPSVVVLVEELIGRVTVCEGLDMGDSHLPLLVCLELIQGTHRPAGAARVSVRSGGVCLWLV